MAEPEGLEDGPSRSTPTGAYRRAHDLSLRSPHEFWAQAASAIDWTRQWRSILDDTDVQFPRWFDGAKLNTCFNAVDRHVRDGHGSSVAIIYESPVTGVSETITYAVLKDQVACFAGALRDAGVGRGDRVLVYMPMIPQTLVAMLACARLGAVHCTVFGGFAAPELAVRIDDCTPKLVVAASCGVEPKGVIAYKPMLDAALAMSRHQPDRVIVFQRLQETAALVEGRDIDWRDAVAHARPAGYVPVLATDPLYILYTSGTTGQPKGVVRDNGGHAVALTWSMTHFYGAAPGETFWAASDIGWQVGHSYTLYGPLLNRCATVLYEGKPVGTPDAAAFWRVIETHRVAVLLTAPTAIRAIRREDPAGDGARGFDLSSLRALFLAGERSDPDTLLWAGDVLNVPAIDHWWQTESGWPIAGDPLGLETFPVKPGSVTRPLPGWDVRVLRADGEPAPPGETGAIVIRLPLAPGALITLWNADERYRRVYLDPFPGFYTSGDAGFIDDDGYLWVMSRTDDVINVAGHRLSTGAIEEILAAHPDVAECAVIGAADALKGQTPLGLLVLNAGVRKPSAEIVAEVIAMVTARIGAIAAFRTAVVVDRLPKTRSGKILRGAIQSIANGEEVRAAATIEDPEVLGEIARTLRTLGYAEA